MWIDFSLLMALKSNYIFFFMFVSPRLFYARGLKPPCNPCGVFTHLFGSAFPHFSWECLRGLQGDGEAVPLHINKIRRRKDARLKRGRMSWITSGSELCNWVSQFLQNCSTPFSSSQSGKANDESASTGGKKNKKRLAKSVIWTLLIKLVKSIHVGEWNLKLNARSPLYKLKTKNA